MAEKSHYKPAVSALDNILLPKSLTDNIDLIARSVHDEWARKRISEGWSYGPSQDISKKHHPSLVPYDELPENEKEYDRQTALTTLKTVVSMGFRID
ncbi:MAG TPA: RyR domain-containing protein [Bacteroidales bacterium]|nr:RyR domain-containing protein [Bacteroidales bacterium]HPT22423.1 RyR domain-containing protein [Bacteroidales bacterium]